MVVEGILSMVSGLLKTVFGWVSLPSFPQQVVTSFDTYVGMIFDNLSLLGLFVRVDTVKLLVPIVIAIVNFERLYAAAMWVLKKIPMLGIK